MKPPPPPPRKSRIPEAVGRTLRKYNRSKSTVTDEQTTLRATPSAEETLETPPVQQPDDDDDDDDDDEPSAEKPPGEEQRGTCLPCLLICYPAARWWWTDHYPLATITSGAVGETGTRNTARLTHDGSGRPVR